MVTPFFFSETRIEEFRVGDTWLHRVSKEKNQQAEALLMAGQRRLKAEGAGRARSALTSQRKVLELPPVAATVHLSPAVYSSSS